VSIAVCPFAFLQTIDTLCALRGIATVG